jgi:cytochrome b subunit of formate dehydrogenase
VALLVSISFLFLALGLLMAWLGIGKPALAVATAVCVMALAFIVYFATPKAHPARPAQRMFPRLTVAQRWQHGLLLGSFTLLVLTGLPIRFYNVDWLRNIYLMLGGLGVLRVVHRVAASVMIATWIWHTVFLVYRWKKAGFALKSWSMFPRWKDVTDFIGVSMYYLGLADEEPKYDRFEFRQKFDYFAVYWGMPIMVFSGLVLWFPVALGSRLPEIGISAAYIAHSDEAILAFLAIVTWHLYNVHFNPDTFPMSPTFYTGTKTQEDMEREHPLELENHPD